MEQAILTCVGWSERLIRAADTGRRGLRTETLAAVREEQVSKAKF